MICAMMLMMGLFGDGGVYSGTVMENVFVTTVVKIKNE